jgi:hypothetical protein
VDAHEPTARPNVLPKRLPLVIAVEDLVVGVGEDQDVKGLEPLCREDEGLSETSQVQPFRAQRLLIKPGEGDTVSMLG